MTTPKEHQDAFWKAHPTVAPVDVPVGDDTPAPIEWCPPDCGYCEAIDALGDDTRAEAAPTVGHGWPDPHDFIVELYAKRSACSPAPCPSPRRWRGMKRSPSRGGPSKNVMNTSMPSAAIRPTTSVVPVALVPSVPTITGPSVTHRTATMAEPSPEFAAAVEAAGLLHAEYPDQMAAASCTCEPEAVCGAHRLLARYQQMYERLVTVQAERRGMRAERDAADARLAAVLKCHPTAEQVQAWLTDHRDEMLAFLRRRDPDGIYSFDEALDAAVAALVRDTPETTDG